MNERVCECVGENNQAHGLHCYSFDERVRILLQQAGIAVNTRTKVQGNTEEGIRVKLSDATAPAHTYNVAVNIRHFSRHTFVYIYMHACTCTYRWI